MVKSQFSPQGCDANSGNMAGRASAPDKAQKLEVGLVLLLLSLKRTGS